MAQVVRESLLITGFVLVMMLTIDYLHVVLRGLWQDRLVGNRWKQYTLAALLGAMPGCLGGFTDVALYAHGQISFGALVGGMLATAGDESFVMFAMIPKQAFLFHVALFFLGIGAAYVTDVIVCRRGSWLGPSCAGLELHTAAEVAASTRDESGGPRGRALYPRAILELGLGAFLWGVATGALAPDAPMWLRVVLIVGIALNMGLVAIASVHTVEEHLWKHVVLKHLPQVFLWTFGSLALLHVFVPALHLDAVLHRGRWIALLIACAVGLIPESGPHMVFVVMYAQGLVPLSILLASSVVQDGHSALPLLAHSRRAFFAMKAVNLGFGLALGAFLLALGF